MVISKDLIIGKTVVDVQNKLELLLKGIGIYNIYLICTDDKSVNLMDIIHSTEIFKTIHTNKNYEVIGLCNGKNEAYLLVSELILRRFSGAKV